MENAKKAQMKIDYRAAYEMSVSVSQSSLPRRKWIRKKN